ncbi:hypothetical protein RND71_002177 [Anisodus tanguticus]|uniref:Uncharacterized protein n=1 Tax=Anisodus tanguticus TaxID=243964 RepID=A0AAE1T2J8_9SOLA|nr:hypothetical protein RND71_002177 [Anisodus tanguticus]
MDGKLQILNPLTGTLIKVLPDHMPKYCKGNCIYYVNEGVYAYDEDSEDDIGLCCCCCGDDRGPIAVRDVIGDYTISDTISNDNHKINDSSRYEVVFDHTGVVTIEDDSLSRTLYIKTLKSAIFSPHLCNFFKTNGIDSAGADTLRWKPYLLGRIHLKIPSLIGSKTNSAELTLIYLLRIILDD